MTKQKVPVSMRAVIQRINRKLTDDDEVLKTTRGERARFDLGDYSSWTSRETSSPRSTSTRKNSLARSGCWLSGKK